MKKRIAFVLAVVMLMLSGCSRAESYVAGVYTSNGYKSSYLDYQFTAPEGCEMLTLEQIAEIMGISTDSFNGDQNALRLEMTKQEAIADMGAYMPSGSIILVYTDTKGQMVSKDVAVTWLKQNAASMLKSTSVSVPDAFETVDLMGKKWSMIAIDARLYDRDMVLEYYIAEGVVPFYAVLTLYEKGNEADRDLLLSGLSAQ